MSEVPLYMFPRLLLTPGEPKACELARVLESPPP